MSLIHLVDNTSTDKNTTHSYLKLYEKLLSSKKKTAKNILEIGIGDFKLRDNGGSVQLWNKYFENAKIYALDIINENRVMDELKNNDNIILYTSTDAYDENIFNSLFLEKNVKFDMMLDDGPHTLESMKQFIKLYSQLLTDDGILIIEDVQSWDWIEILKNEVPEHLKQCINVYDLRKNKNRYDDIVFTINKNNIINNTINNTIIIKPSDIVFVSSHYPINTFYAIKTREMFEKYTNIHGYNFYYDEDIPIEKDIHVLHFNRCESIQKAYIKYPNSKWFVWVDSDVYINLNKMNVKIHEEPWYYPINTGVKFVNVNSISFEKEIYDLRHTKPYCDFPYEQKTLNEYILPKIPNQYIIHDPYILNCIIKLNEDKINDALFIHMCYTSTDDRNKMMLDLELNP